MSFQHYSLIQAPMAGGISGARFVAEASRAGALGSVGAGYLSGAAILESARGVRDAGGDAFAINLFIPPSQTPDAEQVVKAKAALRSCYAAAGVTMPEQFAPLPSFDEQFEAVLEARPAVFSYTFGRLPRDRMDACRARGIALVGTATSVAEAQALAEDGVDAVVLQGEEAGGHRGSVDPLAPGMALDALLAACRQVVSLPLIAAGGLMDGADMARVMRAGAAAAQLGTAFLRCPEADTAAVWKQRLAEAAPGATGVTRAVSGRWARGLANAWMDERAPKDIAPYPEQHRLTSPLRKGAGADWKSLWAGTGAHRSREMPVAELVRTLEEEWKDSE